MDVPDQALTELRLTPKGRGVFALRNLPKGTPVIVARPLALSSERTNYSLQVNFDCHVDLDEPGRLINHSCDPSTYPMANEYGGYTFVSRRDIACDEEITFDYDTTEFFSIAVSECLCGTSRCRGRTRGFYHLPDDVKSEYGEQIGDYARKWKPVVTSEPPTAVTETERLLPYVTEEATALYALWARAARHFPDGFKMLSVASTCSLFSIWPLATNASRVTYAPIGSAPIPDDLSPWLAQCSSPNNEPGAAFDWSPFTLLAALSEGQIDPTPEALHRRRDSLREVLQLHPEASLNSLLAQGASYDVINVPDAGVLTGSDMAGWIERLSHLLGLLNPGGHLVLTLPALRRTTRPAHLELTETRLRELTPGTCLEAVQSDQLGLKVAFQALTEANAGATLVVLSLKPDAVQIPMRTATQVEPWA